MSFRVRWGSSLCLSQVPIIFDPDYAVEKTLYISNHDEDVPKRIAFDFSGWRKVKIRGEGAVFLFHTDILPFHLDRCHEILIEGITIDYERTGYSEGEIVELSGKRNGASDRPERVSIPGFSRGALF